MTDKYGDTITVDTTEVQGYLEVVLLDSEVERIAQRVVEMLREDTRPGLPPLS